MTPTPKDEARFYGKVMMLPDAPGCWLWTAGVDQHGYGKLMEFGGGQRVRHAHRLSWQLHRGDIPAGLNVLHRCDTPPCVNPEHLFLGTQADNTADMIAKGRRRQGVALGERNSLSKLTDDAVRSIRSSTLPVVQIAAIHGVTIQNVYFIRKGMTWRHLLPQGERQ